MPRSTVLVIDDDLSIVELLRDALEDHYRVVTCLDPLDAIAKCAVHRIDAVLTDWYMPGFSGLEVLEVLQQKHPLIRRVLVTAAPAEPEVREALASGLVEALIEKPWGHDDVLSVLRDLLSR